MQQFGPDQVWEDKENLFIRTTRFQEDWPVREFRRVMLRFNGKAYYPADASQRGRQVIYRFEPFDPTIELPGVTIDYDAEYVKIREGNRKRPAQVAVAAIAAILILGVGSWIMFKGKTPDSTSMTFGSSALVDAHGNQFELSELSGDYVWLDFSAPWCPPCRAQAPHMKQLEHAPAGASFVTVLVSDATRRPPKAETASEWAKRYGLDPDFVIADTTGEFSQNYRVRSIPLNVLVSPSGQVLYSQPGTHSADQIRSIIAKHR